MLLKDLVLEHCQYIPNCNYRLRESIKPLLEVGKSETDALHMTVRHQLWNFTDACPTGRLVVEVQLRWLWHIRATIIAARSVLSSPGASEISKHETEVGACQYQPMMSWERKSVGPSVPQVKFMKFLSAAHGTKGRTYTYANIWQHYETWVFRVGKALCCRVLPLFFSALIQLNYLYSFILQIEK